MLEALRVIQFLLTELATITQHAIDDMQANQPAPAPAPAPNPSGSASVVPTAFTGENVSRETLGDSLANRGRML